MKKILLSILLVMLILVSVQAQRRNGLIGRRVASSGSLIFTFGPNYSFADPFDSKGFFGPLINQNILLNEDVSIGFRQIFSNNFGYRASFSYDHFTGSDVGVNVNQYRTNPSRNYSFYTNALQLSAVGEYSYMWGRRYSRYAPNCVYAFAGLGVMGFLPILSWHPYQTSTYNIRTNETIVTPVIPYGIGYRYDLNTEFSIGAEVNLRFTFSDYLDGFKPPPPDSKSNDVFEGLSLTLTYKLF